MTLVPAFSFGIFCLLIIAWQVYVLNSKTDDAKSYLLKQRMRRIDTLNLVSRGLGMVLSVVMLCLGFWQAVPGIFILGFLMSFLSINKQERRKELLARIQREERDMADDFQSTAWYNIDEHINKK